MHACAPKKAVIEGAASALSECLAVTAKINCSSSFLHNTFENTVQNTQIALTTAAMAESRGSFPRSAATRPASPRTRSRRKYSLTRGSRGVSEKTWWLDHTGSKICTTRVEMPWANHDPQAIGESMRPVTVIRQNITRPGRAGTGRGPTRVVMIPMRRSFPLDTAQHLLLRKPFDTIGTSNP